MAKILIADANPFVGVRLGKWLQEQRHSVEVTTDVEETMSRLRFYTYDLVVIGERIAGSNGFSICRMLRSQGLMVPILMKCGGEDTTAQALRCGADDCVLEPLNKREVNARVLALRRRPTVELPAQLTFKHISMNCTSREVLCHGCPVRLTLKELLVLELLLRNTGKVVTTAAIKNVWVEYPEDCSDTAFRIGMYRLRKKIDLDGQPSLIKTCDGMGYMLAGDSQPGSDQSANSYLKHPPVSPLNRIVLLSGDANVRQVLAQAAKQERCLLECVDVIGKWEDLRVKLKFASIM